MLIHWSPGGLRPYAGSGSSGGARPSVWLAIAVLVAATSALGAVWFTSVSAAADYNAAFGQFDSNGDLTTVNAQAFSPGWTAIQPEPGTDQQPKELFYNGSSGRALSARLDSCGVPTTTWSGTLNTGWTSIGPVASGLLYFYKSTTGQTAGLSFDSSGTPTNHSGDVLNTGWTTVTDLSGGAELFYNRQNGVAAEGTVDASAKYHQISSQTFSTGWSIITRLPNGLEFFYNANGVSAVGKWTGSTVTTVNSYKISSGWTSIFPGSNGDEIFYNAANGLTAVARFDDAGNLSTIKSYTISPAWDLIAPLPNTAGLTVFYSNTVRQIPAYSCTPSTSGGTPGGGGHATCPPASAREISPTGAPTTGASRRLVSASANATEAKHRKHRRVRRYRVYRKGADEIAIPPGKPLASAYYHFELARSHPFPQSAPTVSLAKVVIDSKLRRVFLRFSSKGCRDVILTGTFPATKLVKTGRSFHLSLSIPLKNLVTGARSGVFSFKITDGHVPRHSAHLRAFRSASASSSNSYSFSASGALDLYADVLDKAGDKGTLAKASETLPVVKKGAGKDATVGSLTPIAGSYKGSSNGKPISFELSDDKSSIKKLDVTYPAYGCDTPFAEITAGQDSVKLFGAVGPDGKFAAEGPDNLYFGHSKRLAGFGVVKLLGQFAPAGKKAGVAFQTAGGELSIENYGIEPPFAGAICIYSQAFQVSVLGTGG